MQQSFCGVKNCLDCKTDGTFKMKCTYDCLILYIYKTSHLASSVIFQEENVSTGNLSQSYRFGSLNDHFQTGLAIVFLDLLIKLQLFV